MNPYQKTLVDEASGVEVPNERWEAWEEGRKAGIGEVVGWVDKNSWMESHEDTEFLAAEWAAQKKEWGG